jgi:hypothetical protein
VLRQGDKRQITLSMRNIGSAPWKAVDAVRLGSQAPQDNTTWGVGRVELPSAEVPPGGIAQFRIPIVAPTAPGRYTFQWRMLQELVEWFGDYSPETTVHIPLGSSSDVTVRRLPGGPLEFWTTSGANGALFTTWKVSTDPAADWAPWSDFLAEVGGLPGAPSTTVES